MKKILLLLTTAFLFHCTAFCAQTSSPNDSIAPSPKDGTTIDGILKALYDDISGPAGQARDWDNMRTLFVPEARLIPTGKRPDGSTGTKFYPLEEYIRAAAPYLEKMGFYEKQISRKIDQFGKVAQVFSTYESRKAATDEKPFMRGINSIQLWNDGTRWWIVNIFWQNETPGDPIPEKYLPGADK